MGQAILTVASLCLMAALCDQLLGDSRLFGAVRLFLGMGIVHVLMELLEGALKAIG